MRHPPSARREFANVHAEQQPRVALSLPLPPADGIHALKQQHRNASTEQLQPLWRSTAAAAYAMARPTFIRCFVRTARL